MASPSGMPKGERERQSLGIRRWRDSSFAVLRRSASKLDTDERDDAHQETRKRK